MNWIKRIFSKKETTEQCDIPVVVGSSSDKHDCRESGEVIEKSPLLEGDRGDSYMSPPKYYMGDTYNVKCKVCGNSWWQDYPYIGIDDINITSKSQKPF